MLHIGSVCLLKTRGRAGWAAAMKTSPNDARCVIWANRYGDGDRDRDRDRDRETGAKRRDGGQMTKLCFVVWPLGSRRICVLSPDMFSLTRLCLCTLLVYYLYESIEMLHLNSWSFKNISWTWCCWGSELVYSILVNKICKIMKIFEQLDHTRSRCVFCQH